ncbi:MAG: glycosyltransferase family 9 protein [Planctomycetes bacterium]|nr:glycosyltransferase family 9 protein [Planctomycetota bacterium]
MTSPLPSKPRILVVRLSALGDVVFAIPAVAALRQLLPDAQIDWLVEDRHASLLRALPLKNELIIFPRSVWKQRGGLRRIWQHIRNLRRLQPYDAVLDFQGNLKSSTQTRAVPSPLRLGFVNGVSKEGAHRRYHHLAPDPGRVPRALRDLALVKEFAKLTHLDWPAILHEVGPWPLPVEVMEHMAAEKSPEILLHTSVTSYGRDKEWPVENWVDLIQRLTQSGHQAHLLWTPADRPHVESISQHCPDAALAPATPTLEHLIALLDRAKLTIGTDSGPVHLAALRSNVVLGIFGPTDPVRFAPPGPNSHVVSALPLDQPPPKRDRSRRSPLMEQITVDTVFERAVQLLEI